MAGSDESLNSLLDDLEAKARETRAEQNEAFWVCQRRFPRSPFRANCIVYYFPRDSFDIASVTGRTRNLSRCGVGVLAQHVFRTGEPIEVEIVLPDRPSMYMAGIATFSRIVGGTYHETGVDIKMASAAPIFFKDPLAAMEVFEWLRSQAFVASSSG